MDDDIGRQIVDEARDYLNRQSVKRRDWMDPLAFLASLREKMFFFCTHKFR